MGGAVARVADDATAFAERSMPFLLNAVTGWHDAAAGDAHRTWSRAVVDAAADATTGRAYVNFLGDTDAARSSYGSDTYDRLVALKNDYDPSNVFRLNQNIEPNARRLVTRPALERRQRRPATTAAADVDDARARAWPQAPLHRRRRPRPTSASCARRAARGARPGGAVRSARP